MATDHFLKNLPLGKQSTYIESYTPDLLCPIPRAFARDMLSLADLTFYGEDIWNAYEISWLNPKGKPMVAICTFIVPSSSPFIVESKSVKLYLNSFNQSKFATIYDVAEEMSKDFSEYCGAKVNVLLQPIPSIASLPLARFNGVCLDDLDIEIDEYQINPSLLKLRSQNLIHKTFYTHAFKANCRVTGQPDWASVSIEYKGKEIDEHSLLKYLCSFRQVQEFHEPSVERIYCDLFNTFSPEFLCVKAFFSRRGGIDINPWRASEPLNCPMERTFRQ